MSAGVPWKLRSRWIFPVEGEPICDGLISIEGTRIIAVEPTRHQSADLDLGSVAIIPGFVNAHTHLELSNITNEPRNGAIDQIDWLKCVISQRRGTTSELALQTIKDNLRSSLEAGTTLLGDISTEGQSWKPI